MLSFVTAVCQNFAKLIRCVPVDELIQCDPNLIKEMLLDNIKTLAPSLLRFSSASNYYLYLSVTSAFIPSIPSLKLGQAPIKTLISHQNAFLNAPKPPRRRRPLPCRYDWCAQVRNGNWIALDNCSLILSSQIDSRELGTPTFDLEPRQPSGAAGGPLPEGSAGGRPK